MKAVAADTTRPLRLGTFVRERLDDVVAEWEVFARTLEVSRRLSPTELRDHCREMLLAVADEMEISESAHEREVKSKGHADAENPQQSAATSHGTLRQQSGFDLVQLVSEFRALRASVLALWQRSVGAGGDSVALEDHIRFNEAIDRALAESVKSYAASVASSRDMFLAILGHDLRGPLSTISLSAVLLGKAGIAEETRLESAARVDRAASQMRHLLTDLLEFTQSRLGGGMPLKRSLCDVGTMCADVFESFRACYPGQAVSLQALGDLTVQGDAGRLHQVVSNLLHNAVQHGDRRTEVTLVARGDVDDVVLQVCNRGTPIPADALPYIFEPLVRGAADSGADRGTDGAADSADPLDERSKTSLGLGLFIVQQIVGAHGGTVSVVSDVIAGTVFTIRLPRC